MKKLLYITDKDEYDVHSYINALFKKYLAKFYEVHILFFTDYKTDVCNSTSKQYIVPRSQKHNLLHALAEVNVSFEDFDYVFIRNDIEILKYLLKLKEETLGRYKIIFRMTFPKRRAKLYTGFFNYKIGVIPKILAHFQTHSKRQIINQCDLFLPSSLALKKRFFNDITIPYFVCPSGIDPAQLEEQKQHTNGVVSFLFIGKFTSLREQHKVLEAFDALESDNWHLTIVTPDMNDAEKLVAESKRLSAHTTLHHIAHKCDYNDLIKEADVGLALYPDNPIFSTTTPIKVAEYYTHALPVLLTENVHNNTLFTHNIEAWFSDFTVLDIQEALAHIIALTPEQRAQVGKEGQARLKTIRNLEEIATQLHHKLERL